MHDFKHQRSENKILFSNHFQKPHPSPKGQPAGKHEEAEWNSRVAVFLLLLFGVFMLVIALLGDYGVPAMNELEKKHQRLQQQLEALAQQKKDLAAQVEALKTNPDYLRRLAHQTLGLVQPGEVIYHLPPVRAPLSPPARAE